MGRYEWYSYKVWKGSFYPEDLANKDMLRFYAGRLPAVEISQFPYMQKGGKRPDPQPVLPATVRAGIATAEGFAEGRPLLAGGKWVGGRMTSMALVSHNPVNVKGLVFFGFPLHAPGKLGTHRADHLAEVAIPMLFLQGSRDRFAELALLEPICQRLGDRATLHVVDGGDHSFRTPKRSGRTWDDVLDEVARNVRAWASALP